MIITILGNHNVFSGPILEHEDMVMFLKKDNSKLKEDKIREK